MKIALVYDRVNKWGGAERVLLALKRVFPDAPLFTAVYDPKGAPWAHVFNVKPSFLNSVPFVRNHHESLALITPLAFETLRFDGYDAVISVTSADAKNIITKPGCVHICYCLTPTRYLWSGHEQYQNDPGLGILSPLASAVLRIFGTVLRRMDRVASQRPDYYIAISDRVKSRIRTYYGRDTYAVVHPPVDTVTFSVENRKLKTESRSDYFLTVSRLVSYKRIDVLITACNELKLPLIIIGDGHQKSKLKNMAGSTIRFVDRHLTDDEMRTYYRACRAFLYAADEDFGLAAAEAQACGVPVIAYKHSGVAEFVKDGVSGVLYDKQTPQSLKKALMRYMSMSFHPLRVQKQVEHISEKIFSDTMKHVVLDLAERTKT